MDAVMQAEQEQVQQHDGVRQFDEELTTEP